MGEPTPKTAKRILVVDDKEDIRAFMATALEAEGYEVRTAPEGTEALVLQRSRPADLLVTDIFMPGQEGFETITRCRTEFPQTRIIVMSAGTGTFPGMTHDFLATAELLGVDATLRKPFNADQLLDTVRRVLQTR
jgi:DNA-binding response OmpR family regulator